MNTIQTKDLNKGKMFYLVNLSMLSQCTFECILGIAKNKTEILELLWNHTLLKTIFYKRTFEEDLNEDISIYKISEDDYIFLNNLYEKYEDKLEERMESYEMKPSEITTNFWHGVYEIEENDVDFSKNDCLKIINIIKRSKEIQF